MAIFEGLLSFAMVVGMAVFGATGGNPSGSRPNFFGRQHLTFDKGGKGVGVRRGIVRMRNRQSVHLKARVMVIFEG